ncbi:PH domain protein [Trichuris suis]|nr:PH domain protein [Trichuris suis]
MNNFIRKNGWVQRKTPNGEDWKRSWMILYVNGLLAAYDNVHSQTASDSIHVVAEQAIIKKQQQCPVQPPPDSPYVFGVIVQSKQLYISCSTLEDYYSWQKEIENVKRISDANVRVYYACHRPVCSVPYPLHEYDYPRPTALDPCIVTCCMATALLCCLPWPYWFLW